MWPTRKLGAATLSGLAGIATMWATTKGWDTEETVGLIGVLTGFATGWLIPNNPDNPASSGRNA